MGFSSTLKSPHVGGFMVLWYYGIVALPKKRGCVNGFFLAR